MDLCAKDRAKRAASSPKCTLTVLTCLGSCLAGRTGQSQAALKTTGNLFGSVLYPMALCFTHPDFMHSTMFRYEK